MKATITDYSIAWGQQRYKVNAEGDWQTLMFGSFIGDADGRLHWKWQPIPTDKVPAEVREVADGLG